MESLVRLHHLLLLLLLFLLPLALLTETSQDCSEVKNATCDTLGNALLDTAAWYQLKDCEWSHRDKDGTICKHLTPSQNISVQCKAPEWRLKVHCIDPKLERLICFNLANETNQTDKISSPDAAISRAHKFVAIPVVICLVVMVVPFAIYIWRKMVK